MSAILSTNRSFGHSDRSQLAATVLRRIGVSSIIKEVWEDVEIWAAALRGSKATANELAERYLHHLSFHVAENNYCTEAVACAEGLSASRGNSG